jgi:NTP pyrophosphatase (non-canonical NTP hydrolase)
MSFAENVTRWAEDRDLIQGSTREKQFTKLVEEVGELAAALARGKDLDAIDAIGDCAVVLVVIAAQLGVDFDYCCNEAWTEIKDRKGRMVNGVFVKTEKPQ